MCSKWPTIRIKTLHFRIKIDTFTVKEIYLKFKLFLTFVMNV